MSKRKYDDEFDIDIFDDETSTKKTKTSDKIKINKKNDKVKSNIDTKISDVNKVKSNNIDKVNDDAKVNNDDKVKANNDVKISDVDKVKDETKLEDKKEDTRIYKPSDEKLISDLINVMMSTGAWDKRTKKQFQKCLVTDVSNINFPYTYLADIFSFANNKLIKKVIIDEPWYKYDVSTLAALDNKPENLKWNILPTLFLNFDRTSEEKKLKINLWWKKMRKSEKDVENCAELQVFLLDDLLVKHLNETIANTIYDYVHSSRTKLIEQLF